jgi:hypothetical protein
MTTPDREQALGGWQTIDGFGASYDRERDGWLIYTMTPAEDFGVFVSGYDREKINFVIDALREQLARHKSAPDTVSTNEVRDE